VALGTCGRRDAPGGRPDARTRVCPLHSRGLIPIHLRVLAVVPSQYDTSPGQRFRMEQWAPALASDGIEIEFAPFEDARLHHVLYQPGHVAKKASAVAAAFWRRKNLLRRIQEFDVVYVFREAALLGPAVFERVIARSGVPLLFDFDDAVFEPYKSPTNGYLSLLKCPGKTAVTCRRSRHVLAGNEYLAAYARQFNTSVTIVPTTIDTERYCSTPYRSGDPIVIGWSGSHSTVMHLRTIERALKRLAGRRPFRLRVIGASYALEGIRVESLPWRADSEIDDLRAIDIGLMPLPDDRWSRGKCGLKALQYMAIGIPTVCSPVGVNTTIVQHGENGLLAATDDQWVESLERLIDDASMRERLGRAGRLTVERRFSAAVQVPVVRDVLRSIAR
jgi:glycosyltransferase involved in cell wall biosynthesis